MKALVIPFLFIGSLFSAVVNGSSLASSGSETTLTNSLSPLEPVNNSNRAIVSAPDGTIHFVESSSGEILWSFSSGSSTYSAYKQLPDNEGRQINVYDDFYIDFGEDGELHIKFGEDGKFNLHLQQGEQEKVLTLSAEEFLSSTPFVLPGGVILGSKKTTVFLVDEETGKVIHTLTSDDNAEGTGDKTILTRDVEKWLSPSPKLVPVKKPLYVTRIDYDVKHINEKTGQLLWHLMFADINASYQYGVGSFLGRFRKMDLGNKLPNNIQTPPPVYRIFGHGSIEPSISLPAGRQPALPTSDHITLPPGSQPALPTSDYITLPPGSQPALPPSDHEPNSNAIMVAFDTEESKAKSTPWLFELYWVIFGLHWAIYGALAATLMAILLYIGHTYRYKHSKDLKVQNPTPKKRKGRKAGASKQSSLVGYKQGRSSSNDGANGSGGFENDEITRAFLSPNLSDKNNSFADKRKIGKLTVSNKEIAKGSNGTIVLEGNFDGRPVAVKRLVRTHHDVAVKEIQNLIASDQHPNIVRWYGVEFDQDFVYLALERCACSLHELISYYASHNQICSGNQYDKSPFPITIDFHLLAGTKEMELWRFNGYPSAKLLKLMRDIVYGVAHLHELGIVHRDLKPQNVLIIKDRSISAKISDMGISKRLDGDMTSLTKNATGYGTAGWQAPEQLRHERQTRAVDLFSLGCILFFCITGGKHPFGESIERDVNIIGDRKDLFLIDNIPEAIDLISRLLDPNPQLRPNAVEVSCHPLFWSSEMRLSFLRDVSDRVELEDREDSSQLLESLEKCGHIALGGKWDEKMDTAFINDIGRYRRYKYDSVRDLLRVIRNKLNHFRELSKEIQGILGPVPEGFDLYFSTRFPKFLIEVYRVILKFCGEEEFFQKYFRRSQL